MNNDNPIPKKTKRRWLSFSLRGFLLLILLLSIPLAWLGQKYSRMRIEDAVVEQILEANGTVIYEHHDEAANGGGFHVSTKNPAPGPQWIRSLLGEHIFTSVRHVRFTFGKVDDDVIAELPRLQDLEVLAISSTSLTDESIDSLRQIPQLRELFLHVENISPEAFNRLRTHPQLEMLHLVEDLASAEALQQFQSWPHLKHVKLFSSRATDEDLLPLLSGTHLKTLSINWMSKVRFQNPKLVTELNGLEELSLSEVNLDERSLAVITQLDSLKKLTLNQRFLPAELLTPLKSLTRLEVLNFTGTALTAEDLQPLKEMKSLKTVILSRSPHISEGDLDQVEIDFW